MKSTWDKIRDDLRRNTKHFFRFWGIGAAIIVVAFLVYWMWSGPPSSLGGAGKAFLELLVIAILVPPIVWVIKIVIY